MSDTTSSTSTGTTGASSTPPTSTSSGTTASSLTQRDQSRVSGTTGQSALRSQYGTTTIADSVVAKIAALAAREVTGVAELGGSVSGALSGVVGRITGSSSNEPRTGGVNVEVGETQAAVDLTAKVL